MEFALNCHQQPDMAQAIPAFDILRCKFPLQYEFVVAQYVAENLRQSVQRLFVE